MSREQRKKRRRRRWKHLHIFCFQVICVWFSFPLSESKEFSHQCTKPDVWKCCLGDSGRFIPGVFRWSLWLLPQLCCPVHLTQQDKTSRWHQDFTINIIGHKTKPPGDIKTSQSTSSDTTRQNLQMKARLHNQKHYMTKDKTSRWQPDFTINIIIWYKTKYPCDTRTSQLTSPDTWQNLHVTPGLHNQQHHLTQNKTSMWHQDFTINIIIRQTRPNLYMTSDQDITINIIWYNKTKHPCDTKTSQSTSSNTTRQNIHVTPGLHNQHHLTQDKTSMSHQISTS